MTDPAPRRALWRGLRDGSPYALMIIPFAVVFGVAARDAGLDLLQIVGMSLIVIAGGSQFTALGLMQEGAPVAVVVLAALAVNLRMAMYSVALVPHLGRARMRDRVWMAYFMVDQVYALATDTYRRAPAMTLAEKVAYYLGTAVVVGPLWYLGSVAGALIGRAIPPGLSADFAVPICFLALLAPLLKGLPNLVAAGVSLTGAIVFAGVPWNLGLPIAAGLAMAAGAETERRLTLLRERAAA